MENERRKLKLVETPPSETKLKPLAEMLKEFEPIFAMVEDEIDSDDYWQEVLERYASEEEMTLDIEQETESLKEKIKTSERKFCKHILTQLHDFYERAVMSINEGQNVENRDKDLTILFTTTMLSDFDNTLGLEYRNKLKIRPTAISLLRFIKDQFPKLQIGLATTRDEGIAKKQLSDSEMPNNLTAFQTLIEQDLVYGVAGVDMFGHNFNEQNQDYSIYPEYQVYDEAKILTEEGYDQEKISQIFQEKGELLRKYYQGLLKIIPELDALYLEPEIDFEIQNSKAAIIKKAWLDGEYNSEMLDQNYLVDPTMEQFLQLLENVEQMNSYVREDSNLSSEAKLFLDYLQDLNNLNILLNEKFLKVKQENLDYLNRFERDLIKKISLPANNSSVEIRIGFLLQRLALAKKVIDLNKSQVALTIDNDSVAEKMNDLLSGRIESQGQKIDGYALLGLENYRDRLFICSCGEGGAFEIEEKMPMAA